MLLPHYNSSTQTGISLYCTRYSRFGLSSLGTTPQSIETIAEDISGLLDALTVQGKIAVVGHSMGGILASCLAALRLDRVRGVVLIGPVNLSPGVAKAFEDRMEAVKKGVF